MTPSSGGFDVLRSGRRICFPPFELEARSGELRKHGIKVRIGQQPVEVLLMLLARPGEVVLREEIREKLWPDDTVVEFDHSINAAIQKLRDALGDMAENPRFIETLPRRGYRFIGVVEGPRANELGAPVAESAVPAASTDLRKSIEGRWSWAGRSGLAAMAALLVLAIAAAIGWIRSPESVPPHDVSFTIPPPAGKDLVPVGGLSVERISPDGSKILFQSQDRRFYVRELSSFESELLPEWVWAGDPCWSPDSQSIAFPVVGGKLMKMRVPKGTPELVAENVKGGARGASWSEKGILLLAQADAGLFLVPATGGSAVPIEIPGLKEGSYYSPQFLPGGENFIFEFHPKDSDGVQVYIATLHAGKIKDPRLLLVNDTAVAFTPASGGRVLYVRNDSLYSQHLDQKARKLSGDAELVQERVVSFRGFRTAYFSISNSGTLVWRSGTAVVSQITVFDRKGNRRGISGAPSIITAIRLSPDESRLIAADEQSVTLVDANGPGQEALHVRNPFWSLDGTRLIFPSSDKLLARVLNTSRPIQELLEFPTNPAYLRDVSAKGRRILFTDGTALYSLALDRKGVAERIVDERVDDAGFSPDGTWVTYRRFKEFVVYARPVSGSRLPVQLSDGGMAPVWRGDGQEILYYDPQGIWSVAVNGSGDSLRFGTPVMLFSASPPMGRASGTRPLAVSRDGSHIFYLQSPAQPNSGVIRVRTIAIQ